MNCLAVIGAGSWGTALAISLASRFDSVRVWTRLPQHAAELQAMRENQRYLPGLLFPQNLLVSNDLSDIVPDAGIVLSVVPSRYLRAVFKMVTPRVTAGTLFVSATKGLEEHSLLRMSQVLSQVLPLSSHDYIAVLSGPTFASEVAAAEPAAVVIAARRSAVAEQIQLAFCTPALRLYRSTDMVGVELGAALKNVIAIGAGICRGLGLGSNSVAALVTRGLAEITRLAVAMGGDPRTLAGLAGLGDLVLTTTGDQSRNRQVGIELGKGRGLADILSGMSMVAEGVATCSAAHQLGRNLNVELPIIDKVHEILYQSKNVRQAIRELMDRPLTNE